MTVGSSPRVWGQEDMFNDWYTPTRIIPTRVGTSTTAIAGVYLSRDHPHACGDKQYSSQAHCSFQGSSPRVWGQAIWVEIAKMSDGIIPTRVGTSLDIVSFAIDL